MRGFWILIMGLCMWSVPAMAKKYQRPVKKCKNQLAKPLDLDRDHYVCVHKTKYYIRESQCPSGYTLEDRQCIRDKALVKSCKLGQKLCSNHYCVAALKTCKTSNKKGDPSTNCVGSGWYMHGDKCRSVKKPSDQKCPAGWVKSRYRVSDKALTWYCQTSR